MADRGSFHLGKVIDPATGKPGADDLIIGSSDLTTHGVVVGMTGSGKTGLAVVLLEEALLAGIPALIIDPKGDMGNLALTFPDLAAASFQPWVNPSAKLTKRLEAKKDRLANALVLAQRRVEELDTQTKSRQANELITGAGAVLGALFGGRRSARSITSAVGSVASKHGQSATSSQRRNTAEAKAQQTTDDLAQLEQEIPDEVTALDDKWKMVAETVDTVAIRLEATDVRVTDMRLVWVPVD